MHDYAIFGHDRSAIGRWLGVIAVVVSGGISQLIVTSVSLTGWEAFSKVTITVGIVYFILHWIFNKWSWKIQFFKIPNLNGVWKIQGQTLNEDNSVKYDWLADLYIEQNWKQISIHIKTEKSHSNSYTATLLKQRDGKGGWLLSYSYKNEPNLDQTHELNSHKGFCEIEFEENLTLANGTYFNSAGRKTYGLMSLKGSKND